MKKVITIILCLSMFSAFGLSVNAIDASALRVSYHISAILPGIETKLPDKPSILTNPKLEIITFAAPTNLELVKAEGNSVNIKWKDNTALETMYIVERKTVGGEYIQLSVLAENVEAYSDTSAEPGVVYYYRVKAGKEGSDLIMKRKTVDYTDYSNELMVSTPLVTDILVKDPVKPPFVIDFDTPLDTTSEDDRQKFTDSSTTSSVLPGDDTGAVTVPETSPIVIIPQQEASVASEEVTAQISQTPTTAIASPEQLSAQPLSPTEIMLTWADKSNNEQGFLIYRTISGDWEQVGVVGADTAAYKDVNLQPGITYYYVIYAFFGKSFSKESNMIEIKTPALQATTTIDYSGASSWALEELEKAVGHGLYTEKIMNNYKLDITREEFCELVIKLYEKLKGTTITPAPLNTFVDTSNESVLKAYGAGIVNGTGANTFSPNNYITRQDICVMLYRVITNSVPNINTDIDEVISFTDESLLGPWAIKEVKFAAKNNIMQGSASKIMPLSNTSREQALLLIKRVYELYN